MVTGVRRFIGDGDGRHHDDALFADLAEAGAHGVDFFLNRFRQRLKARLLAVDAGHAIGASGNGDDCRRHGPSRPAG